MDLQTKHMVDRNRKGFLANTILSASVLITAILAILTRPDLGTVARAVVSLLVIIFNGVTFPKMKKSKRYADVCCHSMIAVFLVILLTVRNGYTYAYVYPIAMLIMIFAQPGRVKLGAIMATIGVGIYDAYRAATGQATIDEVVIQVMLVGLAAVMAYFVTATQVKHTEENMAAVQSGADANQRTAGTIVKLAEDLNRSFIEAGKVSTVLNDSMNSSHMAMSEIAESTRVNAEAIEAQTSQTSDIQISIESVGKEARSMGNIAERTSNTVEEGVELIARLKKQAAEVAKINTETRETTQKLNESIRDVEAITETILGISSQTNLLALNASIEAARAGEAGKGFAVVADEIRNLSEDTRKATEQIGEIISRLTRDAESAAASMTRSAEYAERQNEIIDVTSSKLADIKNDTDSLNEGVRQVNDSVESIIVATSVITDSITNLSATGEEVAASTDTALALSDSSMEALKNMNGLLQEINGIAQHMENVAK